MKKSLIVVIICIIIAVVFGAVGYFLGKKQGKEEYIKEYITGESNVQELSKEQQIVGLYYHKLEKGGGYTYEFKEDMTFTTSNGTHGTWRVEGDKVYLQYIYDRQEGQSEEEYQAMKKLFEYETEGRIINEGLLLGQNIYEKKN